MRREAKNGENRSRKVSGQWGVGFAIGISVGIVLGIVTGNIGVGIAIGAGIGVALGISLDEDGKRRRKGSSDREDPHS